LKEGELEGGVRKREDVHAQQLAHGLQKFLMVVGFAGRMEKTNKKRGKVGKTTKKHNIHFNQDSPAGARCGI